MDMSQPQDAAVLAYLIKIYEDSPAEDRAKFIDKFERAQLCVERDLLRAENQKLKGESHLQAVNHEKT